MPAAGREYRTAELAREAGITPRTLRFYRERGLLPPPRRAGRIAWYNEHHLARLRTITALLARGHTLGGIAELLAAFEHGGDGRDAAELLGLPDELRGLRPEETPVRLTPEDLADYFEGDVTVDNLTASLNLGYVTVDGDQLVHVSRRLLEASSALVREGIPLAEVLAAGREVRAHADRLAELFTTLARTHLLSRLLERARGSGQLSEEDLQHITGVLQRLRPLAKQAVDAELSLALDRRVRSELDAWHQP